MGKTLISSDIDFDASGKQAGYLRVPHSVDHSAYGWIGLPVVSIKNGVGPTILMLAGNHGDEYEGQIALTKLAQELDAGDINGQIILMSMANYPAAQAGRRVSPIDDGNLNRSFPGDATGTPTQMIAHYIEEVLLPRCDVMFDLHSGGRSLFYPPTLLRGCGEAGKATSKLKLLQEAFDLPYAWVFGAGDPKTSGRNSTGRTAMAAANRKGVVSIMAELGGGGGIDRDILAMTERGLRRALHALGMLPRYQPDTKRGTRELTSKGSLYAYNEGLFEPLKNIADPVAQNELVGRVVFADQPLKPPVEIISPHSGMILCMRAMGQVKRGDAVYQIADDIQEN